MVLGTMVNMAPIVDDYSDDKEYDNSIAEEIVTYDNDNDNDDKIDEPESLTITGRKRYFEDFLDDESEETRREKIQDLKHKNSREQRKRKEQRRLKALRREEKKKKMRVNRDTNR